MELRNERKELEVLDTRTVLPELAKFENIQDANQAVTVAAGKRAKVAADQAWRERSRGAKMRQPPLGLPLMQQLTIITTGGTIDKIYFDDKSDYKIGAPQIGEILTQLGVAFQFEVIPILRKDSLHMADEDRALVRSTIEAQPHRHVLVTHGTDTMVETARELAHIKGKVIVLTGALNPARFQGSDAVFNIGCAVAAVQTLPDGVYITMNGRVWDPLKVRKNRDANRFEEA